MKPLRSPQTLSTMAQVRREFSVTARALRYYEEQGLLTPARQQHMRVYSLRDRERLELILGGRRAGFSLSTIRELLDLRDKEGGITGLAKALPRFKAQLGVLESKRRQLDEAIETLKAASARLSQGLGAAVVEQQQPAQRQA
jgi:DNA-binding transcriptional MerR regulator